MSDLIEAMVVSWSVISRGESFEGLNLMVWFTSVCARSVCVPITTYLAVVRDGPYIAG